MGVIVVLKKNKVGVVVVFVFDWYCRFFVCIFFVIRDFNINSFVLFERGKEIFLKVRFCDFCIWVFEL